MMLVVKNPPTNAADVRDLGSIPGLGRSPGGGHGNSLQYSCLEIPMDRGACWGTVHGFAKNWTQLKQPNTHACMHIKAHTFILIYICIHVYPHICMFT